MESVFHIDTDIECRVLHYGKEVCIVSPGEDGTIHLRKGHHKLTFISKENPADQLTITYEVPENDIEDYIEVRLLPIRDERLAREAEEREIAKEAELLRKQKEIEERKRIEEEKERNRKAEEAERRRREDEIRFAEERRKDEERINALIPIRYQQFLDSSKTHFHYIISRKDTSIDNHTQHYVRRGCKYKNMASHTIPGLGGDWRDNVEVFTPTKGIGEKSEIFPVIGGKDHTILVDEKELINKYLLESYGVIKEFCINPHDSLFSWAFTYTTIEILNFATGGVSSPSRVRVEPLPPCEWSHRYDYTKQGGEWYNRLHGWIEYSPKALAIYDFEEVSGIRPILRDNVGRLETHSVDKKKAIIEFFLYLAYSCPFGDELYKKLLLNFNNKPVQYKEEQFKADIQSFQRQNLNSYLKYHYEENYIVYIDCAGNELIRVPPEYSVVSRIENGIMCWYKTQGWCKPGWSREYICEVSFRDIYGNEIFNTSPDYQNNNNIYKYKKEQERYSILKSMAVRQIERTIIGGSSLHFNSDGVATIIINGSCPTRAFVSISGLVEDGFDDFYYRTTDVQNAENRSFNCRLYGRIGNKYYLLKYDGKHEVLEQEIR